MVTMDMVNGSGDNISCQDGFKFFQECSTDNVQFTIALLKSLALGIIILLTIGGNVLVLMAVAVSPNLRSSTHYLIVNLAVADLLLGVTVLPFSAVFEVTGRNLAFRFVLKTPFSKKGLHRLHPPKATAFMAPAVPRKAFGSVRPKEIRWYFGQTLCTIWAAVDVLYCTASIMSLCVISLDRYIGVTRPLAYSTLMPGRRTSILIFFIWALSIAISSGPLLGWKGPPSDDPYACTINKDLGYVLFSSTGSFYLPMLVILIVYWRIYKAAVRQTKFLECGSKTTKQDVTLRIHLGGRANSTPDIGLIRGSPPRNDNGGYYNGLSKQNQRNHHYNGQKSPVAPLARPELSSASNSHNNEEYDPAIVLRIHRGGGKQGRNNGDYNWTYLAARDPMRPRPGGIGGFTHHGRHAHLHNNQAHHGSQPNSLTPSPPSSSPERKLNPGFGKIAKFRRQKKAAKTLAIVVGVFLLCWFPFFFILPFDALCRQCNVPSEIFDVFFWLGYFNSCLNPFIYACTSREFQRAFRRILCRRRPPRPHLSRAIYRANMQNRCTDRNCNGNSIPLQPIHHWS